MTSLAERARVGIVVLLLVVFQLWVLQGVPLEYDLIVSDDCSYLWHGRLLLAGDGDWRTAVAWSGPHQIVYGLFDRLLDLGPRTPDAMMAVLAVSSTLALAWALRGTASLEAAAALALLWASGGSMAGCMNGVYAAGATAAFLAAGSWIRGREAAGVALGLLAGAIRPEILLWLGAAGLIAFVLGRRRAGLALAGGAAALLAAQVAVDAHGRSALAFRQHYAYGAAVRRAEAAGEGAVLGDLDPAHAFSNPDPWVQAAFGDARTLGAALRADPGEVAVHVAFNLRMLAGFADEVFGRFPASQPARACVAVVLGLLAAAGGAALARELRAARAAPPGASARTASRAETAWTAALALAAPALALTGVLYGPRTTYLIAAFLPAALLAVRGGRALARTRAARRALERAARAGLSPSALASLGLAVLLLAAAAPRRVGEGAWSGPRKWRGVVAAAARRSGPFAVVGDPYRADVLLPHGGRIEALRAGADPAPDVRLVLVHAADLYAYRLGALPDREERALDRLLSDPAWGPLELDGDVLCFGRSDR